MSDQLVSLGRPVVFSELVEDKADQGRAAVARAYLAHLAHNPVPGSIFDEVTRELRQKCPGEAILTVLLDHCYDALLWFDDEGVLVCTVFVVDKGEARMFRVLVREDHKRRGLGTQAIDRLISYVRRGLCFRWLQLGEGRDPAVCHMYLKIACREVTTEVRCRPAEDWYLYLGDGEQ